MGKTYFSFLSIVHFGGHSALFETEDLTQVVIPVFALPLYSKLWKKEFKITHTVPVFLQFVERQNVCRVCQPMVVVSVNMFYKRVLFSQIKCVS